MSFGPLTKMNMERRASREHADTVAQPWDALRVHFKFFLSPGNRAEMVRAKLVELDLPEGWRFRDVTIGKEISPEQGTGWVAIFEILGATVRASDGAHVRAMLNLIK
jgi:hypothetical protein